MNEEKARILALKYRKRQQFWIVMKYTASHKHISIFRTKINAFRLSILFVCLLPGRGFSQDFLKADGQKIVDSKGRNVILRGIGLGGWMLQEGYMLHINSDGQQHKIRERIEDIVGKEKAGDFYDKWLQNNIRKADVDSLRKWGFNSIRLPMHYNLYTLPVEKEPVAGENTWLEKGFMLTDSLLSWCKANRMYLILDMHAAPGGQGNDLNISDRDPSLPSLWESEANQKKMIALWRKLAERYAGEQWIGGYDIINEPNWGFSDPANDKNGIKEQKNESLRKLMMEITAAIREVDKNHLVIIEGNGWGNNYNGVMPLWDKNMALSFHKYWNYNDQASIKGILNYREKYNVPVWLGETGENSNVWFTQAVRLLESNNIGWSWWPLKKLGNSNPFEIRSNPEYDRIVQYWSGNAGKPSSGEAWKGLSQLLEDLKAENNIVHYDVIDAIIRQPFTTATKPFKKNLIGDSTLIHAVDYDLGRNGYAYFDKDTADYHVATGKSGHGNRGHVYRNDGVDISNDNDRNTYYVSDIEDGEWLQYTLQVTKAGKYSINFGLAAASDTATLSVEVNGKVVATAARVPSAGGLSNWNSLSFKNIHLIRGVNRLRVFAGKGGFNLKDIGFVRSSDGGSE